LTTTVFVDFGNNFPGGTLSMTAMQLRDSINGPDINSQVFSGGTAIPLGETINMNQDIPLAIQADILPIVRRAFEPYDINVVSSAVTSIADIQALFALNAGDPSGQFDSWIPVVDIRSTVTDAGTCNFSVGCIIGGTFGLGGLSPTIDTGAGANTRDDSPLIFSDRLAQNANSLAWGVLHEVGHSLSLQHLDAGNQTGPNATQLTSSELLKQFGFQQYEGLFGRFDFPLGNNNADPTITRDHYTRLANDPDIGLRDDNGNGIPDLELSTGTGANDQIDVVAAGVDQAAVAVQPYIDTARTNVLGAPNNYNILSMERLLINAGLGDDQINLDIGSAPGFEIVGGNGTDELNIDAAGGNITVAADGTILIGGKELEVSEVEAINIVNVGVLTAEGTIGDDRFDIQRIAGGDNIQLTINGEVRFTGTVDQRIDVNGFAGNDTLVVDSTNGLITVPQGIRYDGDSGFDSLNLTQTGGSQTSETVHLGAAPGDGRDTIVGPGGTQLVQFESLEPLSTNVVAANFSIAAVAGLASLLQDDNQINYGPAVINPAATWGRLTVDDFEPIEFTNKSNLIVDAGAGSDLISLNNLNIPTALTTITINGGDPTAGSDTAIISGREVAPDAINFAVTSDDDAVVTGAGPVPITLTTIESAVIDGQGGDDTLTYTTPTGLDIIEFTPSPGSDLSAGSVAATRASGPVLMPLSFTGVRNLVPNLTFADASENRGDTLFVAGTQHDDQFSVTAAGLIAAVDSQGFPIMPLIATPGIVGLSLRGLSGDDVFSVSGSHPFTTFGVEGGNPGSGSDVLNFSGGGNTVVIEPGVSTILEAASTEIQFSGIETVNANVAGVLRVRGSVADDTVDVTPTGIGNDGNFRHSALPSVLFNYTNAGSAIFDGGGGGDFDVLNVSGDAGNNNITVLGTDIVVDGSSITVDTDVEAVTIHSLAGEDDIDLTTSNIAVMVTVDAGEGDDNLFGTTRNPDNTVALATPTRLVLLGGSGNDTLIGGSAGDELRGGDGDDTLEGAQGMDRFFGGADNDLFRWIAGDGSDLMEGGSGQSDQLVFIANDANQVLQVYGGGLFNDDLAGFFPGQALNNSARAIFELNAGQVFLNTGDVESIAIDARGGVDNIVINNQVDLVSGGDSPLAPANPISRGTDLIASSLNAVEIFSGDQDDYIEIHGTVGDDNINASEQGGVITVKGASVLVQIASDIAGADTLHIHGQTGNDHIKAAAGLEIFTSITLEGDAGEDFLSADAILIGGPDNDFLQGGLGNDTLNGGPGEDTMVGGGGQDTYDGGDGFDTILIEATSGADTIDVRQSSATTLEYLVIDQFGNAVHSATVVAGTQDTIANVEEVRITAGRGSDTIRVVVADELFDDLNASLRMTVEGGDDAAPDRLAIVDETGGAALADLSILRQNNDITAGTVEVGPANLESFWHVFSGIEFVQVVADTLAPSAPINVESAEILNRLVVFKDDPFEHNNDRNNATHLGANETINLDPTIDPGPTPIGVPGAFGLPGDTDWYRVQALHTGTVDFQVVFEQIETVGARPGLPGGGDLNVNVFDSDGQAVANFTTSDDNDDNERVRIPAVQGEIYYFQVLGDGIAINAYDVTAINLPAAVPFNLELDDNPPNGTPNPPGQGDNSDTGRSQFDNHTYDNTPTLVFRLDDGFFLNDLPGNDTAGTPLGDGAIPIPFQSGLGQPMLPGYAIAIFDEGDTAPATGNAGNLTVRQPLGFATQLENGLYTFTVPAANALDDGSHFLTARVQILDPANPLQTGWGARSESLEIVIDTLPPPVQFGGPGSGLHPDSDSGDPIFPATLVDRITNDVTPTFFGRAEANAIIRAYVDLTGDGFTADDLLIGQTVALPLDGTNQAPSGEWEITSTVDMNDPGLLAGLGQPRDGVRQIFVTAEDLAGNITSPVGDTLQIFIDTQGPQVTDVTITAFPTFNLFTLKPDTPQPTPRVDSLTISLQDFPLRAAGFLLNNGAILNFPSPEDPLAPLVLVGDHSGPIAITGIAYNGDPVVAGQRATGQIVLQFADPLPDDRYTLKLNDNLIDPAGNQLDGESNAGEPIGIPEFKDPAIGATGDEIPGGDFIARFTVDSRPEVATWAQGVVYVDINGNFVWDPEGQDNDAVNRDFVYNFGEVTDAYFAGNFSLNANSSGFDKIGAYGAFLGTYQFFIDTDDNGVGNHVGTMAYQVNAIPVAGNFFNSAADIAAVATGLRPRDEIGAFDGQYWYLDVNGNNRIDLGERFQTNMRGLPVVGDFNGDGRDDLATFNNDTGDFQFNLDATDGNVLTIDNVATNFFGNFGFSGYGEKPVAGDFNLDGIDDIILYVPHQEGQLPKQSGEFHLLISDDLSPFPLNPRNPANTDPNSLFMSFSPAPLGNDLISQFGDDIALPLFGNFDPPVGKDGTGSQFVGALTNQVNPLDTNVDGKVSALDALVVINALGRGDLSSGANPLRMVSALNGYRLDANADGDITALDALRVINGLANSDSAGQSVRSDDNPTSLNWATAADSVAGMIDDEEDDLMRLLAQDQALLLGINR
jgi:Ca2+-binding RTX toxin-like protein